MDRKELRASIEESCVMDFARSGGPGGQNVNKVNSKAIARLRLETLRGLSPAEYARALSLLASRLTTGGELVVQASEERDQIRNRTAAIERLVALVAGAAALPKRRIPTKPGRAARERRLSSKRLRSETKQQRGSPDGL
jgi:ribosome-associated protein